MLATPTRRLPAMPSCLRSEASREDYCEREVDELERQGPVYTHLGARRNFAPRG
jgi:hypothetical protein